MSFAEYAYRRVVIYFAHWVPGESPVMMTIGCFAPQLACWVLVPGVLREAHQNNIIAAFLSARMLYWVNVGVCSVMCLTSFVFLCRLLQTCDPKYFDKYKLEEGR